MTAALFTNKQVATDTEHKTRQLQLKDTATRSSDNAAKIIIVIFTGATEISRVFGSSWIPNFANLTVVYFRVFIFRTQFLTNLLVGLRLGLVGFTLGLVGFRLSLVG